MILGTHDELTSHAGLFRGADPQPLFRWLETCRDLEHGTKVDFLGDKLFARVLRQETAPRDKCRWETHRQYVDLQFILGGGEFIDWAPRTGLTVDGSYDEAADVQFYGPAEAEVSLPMSDGLFVFLFPADAHRPLVADGNNGHIHKVVAKIHRSLLLI